MVTTTARDYADDYGETIDNGLIAIIILIKCMYFMHIGCFIILFFNNAVAPQRRRMMRAYSRRLLQYNTHTCNKTRHWNIALASNHRKIN